MYCATAINTKVLQSLFIFHRLQISEPAPIYTITGYSVCVSVSAKGKRAAVGQGKIAAVNG